MSGATAAAIPTASSRERSRSGPGSSPSRTSSMRSPPSGRTAPRSRAGRPSSIWSARPAPGSTPRSSRRRSRSTAMWALERPWTLRQSGVLADTPLALIATLGGAWLSAVWLAAGGWLPDAILRAVALACMHGGLLAVALAWAQADGGVRLPPGSLALMVLLVAGGTAGATLEARASLALVGAPCWLAILAVRGQLVGLGLGPGIPARPTLVGGTLGAL